MIHNDINKQTTKDGLTSAAELPYFAGDFWPNKLEEIIKTLEEEEKNSEDSKRRKISTKRQPYDPLFQPLKELLEEQKKAFFVIHLNPSPDASLTVSVFDTFTLIVAVSGPTHVGRINYYFTGQMK